MACCFATISTSDVGIIERFGKYNRLANPGLVFVCCPYEIIAGKISLRIQQLDVTCETKTLDNVFVMVNVSVQFQVIREKVYQAFYSLSDSQDQMRSYIYDTLRAAICALTLDQAFDCKDEVSQTLKTNLQEVFSEYGFSICQTLVTDISPNNRVRDAMNEINSSMRIKEASYQRAEGEKLLKVKRAEAEAESMHLSGVGVARSRHAIMDGLKESILEFNNQVSDTSSRDVMDLLVLTQYFDALQEVGSHAGTKTVFLPSDSNSVRSGVMEANAGM
mmetsp:Transcript_5052/g.7724  ORF Transcript_5052/g.7724 Transcript_5052/m.7724 type:complete len:276 (-) Transcript_5052:103-930(-)|eukprot:CAMPEP_0185024264 /NCGR_PEP_ID=MMETSP1103-20130426/7260_1 /TAXON_ID=36769 /ORGANISM="Paraphysomonas bandaiensis, Strain Caron Lab Isolate" /LENGTH=275 /DNA_ID=CAMNT_0027557183 /DNA_START=50 /DNA_END=877 /DNA_ORIENTATION=-